jgi:hypothetical protein
LKIVILDTLKHKYGHAAQHERYAISSLPATANCPAEAARHASTNQHDAPASESAAFFRSLDDLLASKQRSLETCGAPAAVTAVSMNIQLAGISSGFEIRVSNADRFSTHERNLAPKRQLLWGWTIVITSETKPNATAKVAARLVVAEDRLAPKPQFVATF